MSLNHAHWLNRQAAKATRKGHLAEAIDKHREATEVLNEVLASITAAKVAESVKLQIQVGKLRHHAKQRNEFLFLDSFMRRSRSC